MPETRGRTSATRIGAIRPGSSLMIARGCGFTVTMLTWGSTGSAAAAAELGLLQPARTGARAASTMMMPADGTRRDGDMEMVAPLTAMTRRLRSSTGPHATRSRRVGRSVVATQCSVRRRIATRAECHTEGNTLK
jgi:hypothetical protein